MSDLPNPTRSEWSPWMEDERNQCWHIHGRECWIWMQARPHYCDRGNWLAHLEVEMRSNLARDIDGQDGWPRYYFDFERAKLEVEAWLKRRGQWME